MRLLWVNRLKAMIYGLPMMSRYRHDNLLRQVQPIRTTEGFEFLGIPHLFGDGWELAERRAVANVLPNVDNFIDVGANHGFYAVYAAQMGKRVIAVEPEPANLAVLRENAKRCPIDIVPAALSDREGELYLYGDGDMASLDPHWKAIPGYFRRKIDVSTLDSVVAARQMVGTALIKVDVEGFEAEVLRGAEAVLAGNHIWLIESLPNKPTGERNTGFEETFRIMTDAGYRAWSVNLAKPASSADGPGYRGFVPNFLFYRPAHASLVES